MVKISQLMLELKSYPDMDYKQIIKVLSINSLLRNFIKDYCKCYNLNSNKKIAKQYNISPAVVDRLRRALKIPPITSEDNPGRITIKNRIRRMYFKGKSSIWIGKVIKMSPQFVQNMLHDMNVTMNPQHCVNPIFFKTQSKLSPVKLIDEIKRLYDEEKLPLVEIAERVGIWEGTVSSKLKAMGIAIVTRRKMKEQMIIKPNYNIIGIYKGTSEPYMLWYFTGKDYVFLGPRTPRGKKGNCLWCNAPFTSNISKGPRAQKFCSRKCRDKAKDLRRGLKPRIMKGRMKISFGRFRKLALEFTGDIDKLGLSPKVIKEVKKLRQA